MGKKSNSTSTQTSEEYGKAALKQQQLAEQAQDWYESEMLPWLKQATQEANADAIADSERAKADSDYWRDYYVKWANQYSDVSNELQKRYEDYYVPVEDSIIDQASNFDEGAYADRQAGYAIGDLAYNAKNDRSALETAMQQAGYDPTSGHYQAQMAALNDQQAYAQAAAAYTAQEEARNLGWTKQYYAAQQGQQYINNALNTAANANSTASTAGSMMSNALSNATSYSQNALNQISNLANLGVNNYSSLSSSWSNYANLANGQSASNAQSSINSANMGASNYGATAALAGQVGGAAAAAAIKYSGVGQKTS